LRDLNTHCAVPPEPQAITRRLRISFRKRHDEREPLGTFRHIFVEILVFC